MRAQLILMMKLLKRKNTNTVKALMLQISTVMMRKPENPAVIWKGQPPRAAAVPQSLMMRCWFAQLHKQKRLEKVTTTKKARTTASSSSQLPPYAGNKATEVELKCQWHQDTQLLDKHFGVWYDQMLSEGHAGWKEHTKMHSNHGEPHRDTELRSHQSAPGLHVDVWCFAKHTMLQNLLDAAHRLG